MCDISCNEVLITWNLERFPIPGNKADMEVHTSVWRSQWIHIKYIAKTGPHSLTGVHFLCFDIYPAPGMLSIVYKPTATCPAERWVVDSMTRDCWQYLDNSWFVRNSSLLLCSAHFVTVFMSSYIDGCRARTSYLLFMATGYLSSRQCKRFTTFRIQQRYHCRLKQAVASTSEQLRVNLHFWPLCDQ